MSELSILLAEDDPAHRQLLRGRLNELRNDLAVTEVNSAAAFCQTYRQGRFDCAVVDFNLTDARADQLLRDLGGELSICPIVVISSDSSQKTAVDCFRAGATDFVSKIEALTGETLLERIEQAIRQYHQMLTAYRRLERRQHRLARIAETDDLTGLQNRRGLERLMRTRGGHGDRREDMACVLLDIDRFKRINDTFGHSAGDAALQSIARLGREQLAPGDVAIRYGGEEILFVLDSADLYRAWNWAEKFRQLVGQQTLGRGGREFAVTVSMGVVSFPTSQLGQRMIDLADRAMYLAKQTGRNRVCTWQMAVLNEALTRGRDSGETDPQLLRQRLLRDCRHILGPTQLEHVGRHCQAVAELSERLGRAMSLDDQQLQRCRQAALLHDIGKCLLPESLLAQPGPLTAEQRRLIARHGQLGGEIARALGVDWTVAAAIEHHHRHYRLSVLDSSAPTITRIVCVADALTAMLTDRPYRDALTPERALAELRRGSGVQFDPAVVVSAHSLDLAGDAEHRRAA